MDIYNPSYGETGTGSGFVMNASLHNDCQGICPKGWHVPSDADWSSLEQEISGSDYSTSTGYRGTFAASMSAGDDWGLRIFNLS